MDDVFVNKAAMIERCVQRINDEYGGDSARLRQDMTRQDAILLNLQRAAEAAIGLAMHWARIRRLGTPQDSREAFSLLEQYGYLSADLAESLRRMVGFRNVAVHTYELLNLDTVQFIIEHRLSDLLAFSKLGLQQSRG